MAAKAVDVRALRQEAGLSQSGLARLLQVSKNTVARWERGEKTPPPYLEAAIIHLTKCASEEDQGPVD